METKQAKTKHTISSYSPFFNNHTWRKVKFYSKQINHFLKSSHHYGVILQFWSIIYFGSVKLELYKFRNIDNYQMFEAFLKNAVSVTQKYYHSRYQLSLFPAVALSFWEKHLHWKTLKKTVTVSTSWGIHVFPSRASTPCKCLHI